jgi:hypothetical protein
MIKQSQHNLNQSNYNSIGQMNNYQKNQGISNRASVPGLGMLDKLSGNMSESNYYPSPTQNST